MLSSSSFFSPAENIIETKASCSHEKLPDSELDTTYEIQRCVDWITGSSFQRVNMILIIEFVFMVILKI